MRLLQFLQLVLLMISHAATAQEYVYKHYNSKDGLANSCVYQMLQDKDGFMWFATSAGLSRFDGKDFKTFTTSDGLPTNTILRVFEDSRGRIWLMPFKNTICYYYKGKIYNQDNDSLLRKINLQDYTRTVVENKRNELLLTDSKKLYHIDAQNNVKLIDKEMPGMVLINGLSAAESGDFYVCYNNRMFVTDTKTFRYVRNEPQAQSQRLLVLMDTLACWLNLNTLYVEPHHKKPYKQFIGPANTMHLLSDSVLCINTTSGTIFYNLLQKKIEKRFLPNGNVSHFLVDKEGGFWFSTLNDGVYRLSSPAFKSITGQTAAGQKLGVYNLKKFNNEIWASCDLGHLLKIKNNTVSAFSLTVVGEGFGSNPVYSVAPKENRLAVACGNYVFIKDRNDHFEYRPGIGSSKEIAWKNDRELVVASSHGLYTKYLDGKKKDSLHKSGRLTSLHFRNDSTWFGTFDGLYLMKPDASIIDLGKNIPLLRASIISICEGLDGTIWVATYDNGLIGLQNNAVKWHFNKRNGLSGDRVRCIGIDSGVVWAATEKDLSKIPLETNPVITRYSYSDELNANIITTLLVDENIVYAGTPDGITWFDKRDTLSSSLCNLKVLGVAVNEKERELQPSYFLPHKNNSIRFDYVAISMKSAGNMVYHYRLNGLDSNWKSTTQTSLDLISLPPGKYKLELFAVNKFDVKSQTYSVSIFVEEPFWKNNWFIGGAVLLIAFMAWFIGTLHNRAIIRKEKLRRISEQQLLDLEQKALRAQMNPHFIFNCLHSIQGFILDEEPEKANKYLTQFANLIRQTLENSFQSFIVLADEIKYLGTYLQLEQMRSESKFQYSIETADGLSTDAVSIPVMVLQPFVENAVRHGVQSISGREGLITIHFSISGQELVCRIGDNGIGRQQAQLQKSAAPTVYRSRGMQLTYERIELINTSSAKKIVVEVMDKFNERNEPSGTDVIIRFPIFTA